MASDAVIQRVLANAPSGLSNNTITIDVLANGRVEITFETWDGEETWGEALQPSDVQRLRVALDRTEGE